MLETMYKLGGATTELKRLLGLVQLTSEAKQRLDAVLSGLGQVVDASFVIHAKRSNKDARRMPVTKT